MLETLGITKIGYKTDKVPGFWTEKTNLNVDHKINKIEDIIKIIQNRKHIKQKGSILIYNPVPNHEEVLPSADPPFSNNPPNPVFI